jgi:putative endopeptidase
VRGFLPVRLRFLDEEQSHPADQAMWGRFNELMDRNRDILHEILEQAAKPAAGRDATTQKIGDYYAACMDEKAIDAKGLAPLEPELDRIRNLNDKAQLADEIAHLHSMGVGAVSILSSGQDFKDSNAVIAQFDQGGLGLPDRDYYLKDDPKSVELRQKYVAHVAAHVGTGRREARPGQGRCRGGDEVRNRAGQGLARPGFAARSREGLPQDGQAGTGGAQPGFPLERILRATGAPAFESINVSYPEFVKDHQRRGGGHLAGRLEDLSHLAPAARSAADAALRQFVPRRISISTARRSGTEAMRPRWKRCVDFTDAQLGEALGRKYVEKTFGAEGKARTLKMVDALEKALGEDIEKLDWMTPATKAAGPREAEGHHQ